MRLRDDAEAELYVSAPDSVALAEKLVSLLVGWTARNRGTIAAFVPHNSSQS